MKSTVTNNAARALRALAQISSRVVVLVTYESQPSKQVLPVTKTVHGELVSVHSESDGRLRISLEGQTSSDSAIYLDQVESVTILGGLREKRARNDIERLAARHGVSVETARDIATELSDFQL
jgi:hypothetical protein